MRSSRSSLGFLILITLLCGCSGAGDAGADGAAAFVDEVARHAIVIEDVEVSLPSEQATRLREAVGAARLVGLGESRHDTREQTLLKATLVRSLVEDQGFRALILEESFPHVEALDRYVVGGAGDPREILDGLAGWYLWDTEEMLALIQWLRRYNEEREPGQRVRVFGMDITAPAPGVRQVLDRLRALDADRGLDESALGLDLQAGDFWPATWERYGGLTDARRQELAEHYDRLVEAVVASRADVVAADSEAIYEHLLLLAEIGRSGNALFSTTDRAAGGAIREAGMAHVIQWILAGEMRDEKTVMWAHNLHVGKSPFRMPAMGDGAFEPVGALLAAELGDDYVAMGAAFGSGSYPPDLPPGARTFETPDETVVDGALARVGESAFVVDWRRFERGSAAATWLRQEWSWVAQDAVVTLVPGDAFDLVFFVPSITRSQPTPLALQRYRD